MSDLVAVFEKPVVSKDEVREIISHLEAQMLEIAEERGAVEIPVTHHFSKDVYAREIEIPKGTIVVGKIHKYQNLNILSKGEISLFSVDGCIRVKAPYTVVSSPGVKRFAYAHEDCVWTTIHGTNETDVDKIETIFIAKSYDEVPEIDGREETKWLG